MAIIVKNMCDITQDKLDRYLDELERLQGEIVEQCKFTFGSLLDLDYIYELRDYLDEIIEDWEPIKIDLEYDEDDEDDEYDEGEDEDE